MTGKTVDRKTLSRAVQETAQRKHHVNCSPRLARHLVDETLRHIVDTLAAGEDVLITGFGKFRVLDKDGRTGRNPKTSEIVPISPRRVVTFRPSTGVRARVERGNRSR